MKLLIVDERESPDDLVEASLLREFPSLRLTRAVSPDRARTMLQAAPAVDRIVLDTTTAELTASIPEWLKLTPSGGIVVSSPVATRVEVMAAIRAGAMSFIVRTSQPDEWLAPLRVILAGGIWLPPVILERRAPDRPGYGTWIPAARRPDEIGLSAVQSAVLKAYVQGRASVRIAHDLSLAETEVQEHLAALFKKLDANGRLPTVLAVARLGLRWA